MGDVEDFTLRMAQQEVVEARARLDHFTRIIDALSPDLARAVAARASAQRDLQRALDREQQIKEGKA